MTRTMKRLTIAAVSALVLTAGPGIAQAQTPRAHAGVRGLYNFDAEEFGLGAQATIPIGTFIQFYPSFDYYFVDPGNLFAFNADLKYAITGQNFNWLYIGGGLNVTRFEDSGVSDSQAGLNLFVGGESLRGSIHPFAELRLIVGDGSSGQVVVGLNFTLGRHQ